jgi:hypothetical protein
LRDRPFQACSLTDGTAVSAPGICSHAGIKRRFDPITPGGRSGCENVLKTDTSLFRDHAP